MIIKDLRSFLYINLINTFFIIVAVLANNTDIIKIPVYGILFVIYILFLLSRDTVTIIRYQISYMFICYTLLDYLFYYTSLNIPLELKYMIEIISLILIMKIISKHKEYIQGLKDPLIALLVIFIALQLVYCLLSLNSFIDFFNGIRIYFRFIPVYIILCSEDVEYKYEYYFYYAVNLIVILLQCFTNINPDNLNGIFGLPGTSSVSIFMLILLMAFIVKYLSGEVSIIKLIILITVSIAVAVIQENKAFIVIEVIILGFVSILNKGNKAKKFLAVGIMGISFFLGINMLVAKFPAFKSMIQSDTMYSSIDKYLFGNNNPNFEMGRFETISYLGYLEMDSSIKKVFGNGVGAALPTENWYYSSPTKSSGRNVIDNDKSRIYEKYGAGLGYHLSSTVVLYLETGLLGVILIILIWGVFIRRSLYLIFNCDSIDEKIIGAIGIMLCISIIFPVIYGSDLGNRSFTFLIAIIFAVVSRRYKHILK